jgi:HSP90 family molecular chaperone
MMSDINIKDFFSASDHKLIIRDIRAMYHHQWDIIGESIQNSVDSVLKRKEEAQADYTPTITITYNCQTQELIVEDNGGGILTTDAKNIAAPHISFKNPLGANRGEFGVGLTGCVFIERL